MNGTIISENYNEQKKKEIILNVSKFVKEHAQEIEKCYNNAQGENRSSYIKKITTNEYLEYLIKVSVVIITANEYEENILNYYAYKTQKKPVDNPILEVERKVIFRTKRISFSAYILKIDQYTVLHLHAQNTGSYTIGGSADMVRYIAENEYLHPKCIISFGICFGHDHNKQQLGDTIIAEKLFPYFVGAKLNDGKLLVKSLDFVINTKETSDELYDSLYELRKNGFFSSRKIEGNVEFGELITGEAVVSDDVYKQAFETASHIVSPKGGEMEGYGLGKECLFYNIPCMLIKSICDWGNAKNIDEDIYEITSVKNAKDKIQAYTAYCAFTVLKEIFEHSVFPPSHYELFQKIFIRNCETDNGCYVPFSEVQTEFMKYNKELKPSEIHKILSENYIKYFCKVMVKDGVWKEKNCSGRGYVFLN